MFSSFSWCPDDRQDWDRQFSAFQTGIFVLLWHKMHEPYAVGSVVRAAMNRFLSPGACSQLAVRCFEIGYEEEALGLGAVMMGMAGTVREIDEVAGNLAWISFRLISSRSPFGLLWMVRTPPVFSASSASHSSMPSLVTVSRDSSIVEPETDGEEEDGEEMAVWRGH